MGLSTSGGSKRISDRGSTLQFWALCVWWVWLAWKLDLGDYVSKQNPRISIFRKLGSLKSDRGSSPLRPPLDPPLLSTTSRIERDVTHLGHCIWVVATRTKSYFYKSHVFSSFKYNLIILRNSGYEHHLHFRHYAHDLQNKIFYQ